MGRELWLFNGLGGAYKASIHLAHPKRALVNIGEKDFDDRESPLRIELGIGVSKGDRFDFVVQKATELGVTSIQPLNTEHVDVRLNKERAEKKCNHWAGIIESACEQSGRNILPRINAPKSLDDWCKSLTQQCKITMNPENGDSVKALSVVDSEVAVLVGPEGGLSLEERKRAEGYGFTGITLGPRVLRTETAPLAIISLLQCLWGDF